MIIPRHKVCDFCKEPVGVNKRYFKIKSKNYLIGYAGSCSDNRTHHICEDCIHRIINADDERMFYVQETVNTIMNSCTGDTAIDKAFRNAARLVQNAIDGKSVDFEEIERSENNDL